MQESIDSSIGRKPSMSSVTRRTGAGAGPEFKASSLKELRRALVRNRITEPNPNRSRGVGPARA